MGNLLTGVVVILLLCLAVVMFVMNRTSMTETPPLSTVAFVFTVAVIFSSGFTMEMTETEAVVEVTRLGSEFTVTTDSGNNITVYAEPYAGDDYLLKRTTSVCTWGLSKTETCKLLVPTQPVVVYEKDKGE